MNRDNVLNVLVQSEDKQARFLAAWKLGVALIGPHLFGPGTLETAHSRDELRPLKEAVDAVISRESGGETQLLASMVSFYDPAWGEELAAHLDCYKSLSGLTYNLDHASIEILCELLRNYEGW